jgi:hypothetical protein
MSNTQETYAPEQMYLDRVQDLASELKAIKRIEIFLSSFKLLIVVTGVFIVAASARSITWLGFLGFVMLFVAVAVIHEHFIKKRDYAAGLKTMNENELKALDERFLDVDDGEDLNDPDHPYTSDLDVFGKKSLFHFINRTAASAGKKTLSRWLKAAPKDNPVKEIIERQQAVRELSQKVDFRQTIQAAGSGIDDSLGKLKSFHDFLEEPFSLVNKRALVALIYFFPILTLSFLVLTIYNISDLNLTMAADVQRMFTWLFVLLLLFILNKIINRRIGKRVPVAYGLASKYSRILNAYARIIETIENENFSCSKLNQCQDKLTHAGKPASKYIKRFSTTAGYFNLRLSPLLYAILNNLLLWDLHCLLRFERLKAEVGQAIPEWFEVIGEIEALSSIANTYFNNPDWVFPEISPKEFKLEADEAAHPLIPQKERIPNSLTFRESSKLVIVTGPNMAGKTTFLKTIGINIVLALAGSPVCAGGFITYPFHLYSSMKLSDSLDKKLSLFYAELLRLKIIYDAILRGEPVFYLIDEMLKGTNAMDRQKGSIAFVHQLADKQSKGILATHDLKLTRLEEDHPQKIQNYHFDGNVIDDKLIFDYQLKSGVCQSSTALKLMRKIGIEI